jgi:peptidoglycan/LPS O-acetylase OafA/YrhL
MKQYHQTRNSAIDVIRGLAILFVILRHLQIHFPHENSLPSMLNKILFFSGYYSVIIFFVVSEFLITNSIKNKWGDLKSVNILKFYQMRFARIAPCLFALLFLLSILSLAHVPYFEFKNTTLPQVLFAALTFHINVLESHIGYLPAPWGVLWSLSIEEMFYIFFPLCCVFICKQRYLVIILMLFILAEPLARTLGDDVYNGMWQDDSYFSCMGAIAFGILAALYHSKATHHIMIIAGIIGSLLILLVFVFRYLVFILGLTYWNIQVSFLELGVALLLIALSRYRGAPIGLRLLCWYGRNSYEIYLTHSLIIIFCMIFFKDTPHFIFLYISIIIASGVVGSLVARYFSEPLNRCIRWQHE